MSTTEEKFKSLRMVEDFLRELFNGSNMTKANRRLTASHCLRHWPHWSQVVIDKKRWDRIKDKLEDVD